MSHVLLLCVSVIFLTCDKYKSSLRHIHDPVLLSLNMKGIRLLYFIRERLLDVQLLDVVRHSVCLTTSINYTSNNLLRMKNQRLLVQF
jgi:hypothetical protein